MIIAQIGPGNTGVNGTRIDGEIVISLFDAATGQPTNGDNVIVSYTQNINGNITESQATISGQSLSIYQGEISNSDPANGFYTKFQIDGVSQQPDPSPPVNQCDLKINFITVDQPESAPGAGNAQITINASSSYGPILYSNDFGATYQASPTFTNLGGGLAQPVVKDSNSLGCTDQSTVTIPVLSNLLVSDPSVTLTGENISRWSAAFNPIVFSYQRKDFEILAIEQDTLTGNAAVSVNCDVSPIATAIAANAQATANAAALNIVLTNLNPIYVYINAGSYIGNYQVLSVSDTNRLIINTTFTTAATGFININLLRPYYQIRTQITYQDALTGVTNNIISTNRPDATGLVKADISNFLQSLLRAKDDSNFTQLCYRDSNLCASYTIAYAEYWDGKLASGQTLTYIPVTTPYYALYAAKQLGNKYGGNLAAYVPFPSVTDSTQLAQWITDFEEPAYTNGYPFDISFIYSESVAGLPVYCELTPLDINRNPIDGGPQTSYLINNDGSSLLTEDGGGLVIANQTTVNTSISGQVGLNRILINASFGSNVYYFNLMLNYAIENTTHTITQTQTVRIDNAVDENSVYLRWVGLTGSWNYYRFVYNQEVSLDVQNAVIIKNYVFDWENQDSIEEVIGKSAGQKIKVMAEDLSVADIKGLQSIKYSPKVQMLISGNPVKWQTIVLNTATFSEYETLNGQAPFSVTFNLPSINIQSQ